MVVSCGILFHRLCIGDHQLQKGQQMKTEAGECWAHLMPVGDTGRGQWGDRVRRALERPKAFQLLAWLIDRFAGGCNQQPASVDTTTYTSGSMGIANDQLLIDINPHAVWWTWQMAGYIGLLGDASEFPRLPDQLPWQPLAGYGKMMETPEPFDRPIG